MVKGSAASRLLNPITVQKYCFFENKANFTGTVGLIFCLFAFLFAANLQHALESSFPIGKLVACISLSYICILGSAPMAKNFDKTESPSRT